MRAPARASFRAKKVQAVSFPSPTAGWISNQNISSPDGSILGARVLDNYAVTARDIVVRRGKQRYATFSDETKPITALWTYNNGTIEKMFAANQNSIYDVTNIDGPFSYLIGDGVGNEIGDGNGNVFGIQSVPNTLQVLTGFANGDWITTQFATTGGVFTVAVNGANAMLIYDGDRWYSVSSADISIVRIDNITGTFEVGDVVTGTTSGAVGNILYVDPDKITIRKSSTASFQDNEPISANPSGATATANGDEELYFLGVTGVDTRVFNFVWSYKGRLFFIERNSMNVWYLDIDAIGGKAEIFPMGGLYPSGGYLMFGAAWSMDSSGDGGLSEQNAFFSSEGEVVVYQGVNPSLADQWSKVGLYHIGPPRGKRAWVRTGGDIDTATDVGVIKLSQAASARDIAAVSLVAATYPIEPDWQEAVDKRPVQDWIMHHWLEGQSTFIVMPKANEDPHQQFVAHGSNSAWSRYTGWEITAITTFQGRLYGGSSKGRISQLFTSGLDDDQPYTSVVVPLFVEFGTALQLKMPRMARAVFRGPYEVNPKLKILQDYIVDLPSAPQAEGISAGGVWGEAIWGSSQWAGQASDRITQKWTPVNGRGYALSPAAQITSGSLAPLDAHLVRIELTFETGDIVS